LQISKLDKGVGTVRFNHLNGKPYFISNYNYYKLSGAYAVTNGDESKASQAYYKNGQPDSIFTSWYPNGKIQSEGSYSNGTKTGDWKYYNIEGKLSEVEKYAGGELEGEDTEYDEKGAKTKISMYKDGERHGETRYFGDNGTLMMVFYYKNDKLQGYSYEDKAGKLVPMIPLVKDEGVVDAYYKNGVKSAHLTYKAGVQDGERIFYSTNGKVIDESFLINGLYHGTKKSYYPNGKIKKEVSYYYDELHGATKYYNEDGTLMYDVNYYLDRLNGNCRYYTAGKLEQTYTYYDGELQLKK
jgi:antitoxin component YwqK of YwqJK toxin-antitoxin module